MKIKEKILTLVPCVILIIQLLFLVGYLYTKTVSMFCDFNIAIFLHICSYLVDIIAIVALIKRSKRLLSVYWISMVTFSVYDVISIGHSSVYLNFTIVFEIMMYIVILLSTLELSQTNKEILKRTYYIKYVLYFF